ncbi:hypothetical protein PTB13_23050, partial [Bacillus sp. MHSD17]|nr:hypothetical protein [Bacillus sp. MHSD17]
KTNVRSNSLAHRTTWLRSDFHVDVIGTNIESLLSCDFYQKGEAMRVIEKYPDILHKTLELAEHYYRSATVVRDACIEMFEKDEQLREILSKL